eukprot:scaffold39508_cov72-Cyclotella_meneghiniana.AAC.2
MEGVLCGRLKSLQRLIVQEGSSLNTEVVNDVTCNTNFISDTDYCTHQSHSNRERYTYGMIYDLQWSAVKCPPHGETQSGLAWLRRGDSPRKVAMSRLITTMSRIGGTQTPA